MTVKTVPIRDSLERGWDIFKNNVLFLVVVFVVAAIVYAIAERTDEIAEKFVWPGELLVAVGYLVAVTIVELVVITVTLKFIDAGKADFEDIFSEFGVFFKFFIAYLLYGAMVGLGFEAQRLMHGLHDERGRRREWILVAGIESGVALLHALSAIERQHIILSEVDVVEHADGWNAVDDRRHLCRLAGVEADPKIRELHFDIHIEEALGGEAGPGELFHDFAQ